MLNNHKFTQVSATDQPNSATVSMEYNHSNETSNVKSLDGAFNEIDWAQVQNNLHLLQGTNIETSQYLQLMPSNNNFTGGFSNNHQTSSHDITNSNNKKNDFTGYMENDPSSFQLPQAQEPFQYQNFSQLDLSQFQLPPHFELESPHTYLDCLTPNFFPASARPPPPTPDSPFLISNPYLELSGLTPSQFNLPLTPSSRSSPYGMHMVPPETLLPPSAFPDQQGSSQGAPVQLSCTSLLEQPSENTITGTLSSLENNKTQTTLFSSSTVKNGNQGPATASKLLCLDKNSVSFTEPTIDRSVSSEVRIDKSVPNTGGSVPANPLSTAAKGIPCANSSRSDFTSSPQPSPSLNSRLICAPASLISSNPDGSPVLNSSKHKRFKKTGSVRKLLPLLPTIKSTVNDSESSSVQPCTVTESPMLAPVSSVNASPLTLVPQNSLSAQLASKSNYQLLREGRTTELGLDFGPEASASLNRKRQAHKDAERIRRQNQTDQLQALRQVLPQLPPSASKMSVLSEARSSLLNYESLVEQQSQWIKLLLGKLCPDGNFPPDLPSELEEYLSASTYVTKN